MSFPGFLLQLWSGIGVSVNKPANTINSQTSRFPDPVIYKPLSQAFLGTSRVWTDSFFDEEVSMKMGSFCPAGRWSCPLLYFCVLGNLRITVTTLALPGKETCFLKNRRGPLLNSPTTTITYPKHRLFPGGYVGGIGNATCTVQTSLMHLFTY